MSITRLQKFLLVLSIVLLSTGFITTQLLTLSQDVSLSEWEQGVDGYIKASQGQQETGEPIALFFYTDWCESCEALRKNVLATHEMRNYLKNMYAVKINPERGSMENKLAEEYGVIGYPTFFLLDTTSGRTEQIHKTYNVTPQQFIKQLEIAKAKLTS